MKRFTLILLGAYILAGTLSGRTVRAEEHLNSLPAFQGAQGFGATTPGGRGGRVIHVTNLNGSGPGSLQSACSADGPRIVVFDTCGVIRHDVEIQHGQITIMGQTAPSPGITIRGMLHSNPYRGYLEDIVVRFLRVRPDSSKALNDMADGICLSKVRNCVIDHVTVSWASDENIDIYQAQDITVQWCAIEESDTEGHWKGTHGMGLINGPEGRRVTVHHNLFAHNSRRNPCIKIGPCDVANNVVYNFKDGFHHDGPSNREIYNIVGNYYKNGPDDYRMFVFCFQDSTRYYLRDNYLEGTGLVQDPWAEADKQEGLRIFSKWGVKSEVAAQVPYVTTHDPLRAYDLVLSGAGCFPRDAVSRRTVDEVRAGTGSWGRRDPGMLNAGLPVGTRRQDSDSDGMPDAWEKANGFDPADSTDHRVEQPSGYTAIETYCNQLAEKLLREYAVGEISDR
jgi:pectate lyase